MVLFFLHLIKYKLSLAVTLSAATGYILFRRNSDPELLLLITGVFCLAGGSAALNEVQERKTDALMRRTQNRPVPSGKVSVMGAFLFSALLIIAGTLLLSITGLIPAALGLVNLLLYNGIYTNLKRHTSFAVLPGSLVGAIPPMIGWSAAGGSLAHPSILYLATLLFLWQIPHFWLLIIRYGKEYEEAGFRTLKRYLNDNQIKRLIFSWIAVSSGFILTAPLFRIDLEIWVLLVVAVLNAALIGFFFYVLFLNPSENRIRMVFILTNVFLTVIMTGLIIISLS